MRPRSVLFAALASLPLAVGCSSSDAPASGSGEGASIVGASSARPSVRLQGDGSGGTILVVVSKANTIDLKPAEDGHVYLPSVSIDASRPDDYITGVFARELSEPLLALAETGKYTFEFASEDGALPTWDTNGWELPWFFWGERDPVKFALGMKNTSKTRDEAVSLLQEAFGKLVMSDKATTPELKKAIATWQGWADAPRETIAPKALAEVAAAVESGSAKYAGLLVPGGHAPMSDLAFNADLGRIVNHFHETQTPIGVICHGPVALMSQLSTSDYAKNVPGGWKWQTAEDRKQRLADWHAMKEAGVPWAFSGYTLTIESTPEEQVMENVFAGGRRVAYYVDGEMEKMGGSLAPAPGIRFLGISLFEQAYKVAVDAASPFPGLKDVLSNASNPELAAAVDGEAKAGRLWLPGLSKVSVDREVISGQSPASARCVGIMMDRAIRKTGDVSTVDCDGNE